MFRFNNETLFDWLKELKLFSHFSGLSSRLNILEFKLKLLTKILNVNRKCSLIWSELGVAFLQLYLIQKDSKIFSR